MVVFYALAATLLACLKPDDWAVRHLGLPAVAFDIGDAARGLRFAVAIAIGFSVANVFCWLMNRHFVFRPGRHVWYREFAMFFGTAAFAMALATGASSLLIRMNGMMTSAAAAVEVVVSFAINYLVRRFCIFKG